MGKHTAPGACDADGAVWMPGEDLPGLSRREQDDVTGIRKTWTGPGSRIDADSIHMAPYILEGGCT